MDPWKEVEEPTSDPPTTNNLSSSTPPTFDDNFTPTINNNRGAGSDFEKLPDSQEYLASLEKRLASLQKQVKTSSSLVTSLSQAKESYMLRLLSSDNSSPAGIDAFDFVEEEALRVNPILKRLAPETQAISSEELIHLLTADQLSVATEATLTRADEGPAEPEPKSDEEEHSSSKHEFLGSKNVLSDYGC